MVGWDNGEIPEGRAIAVWPCEQSTNVVGEIDINLDYQSIALEPNMTIRKSELVAKDAVIDQHRKWTLLGNHSRKPLTLRSSKPSLKREYIDTG